MDILNKDDASNFLERIVYIAWFIWKARNEAIFNFYPINPEVTMRRAFEAFREYSESMVSPLIHVDNPNIEDFISQWRAPERGCLKLNCDVAVSKFGKEAKMAVTVRDYEGALINGAVGSACIFLTSSRRAFGHSTSLWYGERSGPSRF